MYAINMIQKEYVSSKRAIEQIQVAALKGCREFESFSSCGSEFHRAGSELE